MIVLSKKRLILTTSIICISLISFMIKDSFAPVQTVETVTLPVSNKVIVIDAGHGVPDERSRK